jgi:uncharacterized protein YndB with AHSA1/START domain
VHPITVSVVIDRPREEIFEYLADVANHPEFKDHYLTEWHLTREDSEGEGAGARMREKLPLNRYCWVDYTLVDVEPPYRLRERGRLGKFNRIRSMATWTLTDAPGGLTRVEYTLDMEPRYPSDRLLERRGWRKRKLGRTLRRLQSILEENRDRGGRVTVAAR